MPERSAAGILWLMFRDADTQLSLRVHWRIRYSQLLSSDILNTVLKMKPVE